MSSVTPVPETASTPGDELDADDAWRILRRTGLRRIAREAFARFRYGDGFSHSRALGLQLCLAGVPLTIAIVGLSATLHAESVGQVLRRTVLSLTPGASGGPVKAVLTTSLTGDDDGNALALWLGLAVALVALTTAAGQVQRGANRIYGIRRDRPSRAKYGRATLLAAGAGLPVMLGVVILVAVEELSDAVEEVYGLDDDAVTAIGVPSGVVLILGSVILLLRHAPDRRQPGWSWLAVGAVVTVVLWLGFTALLAAYLQAANGFSAVYGPLTGIMALLLWAQLTSVATFLGLAFAAQLEAIRAGVADVTE